MTRYGHMTKVQLRDALERLQAIVDGSRDAVFISDEQSRFVLVNPAACELTGYSEEELLGMRIPDLHEAVDRHAYAVHHVPIMNGEEALTEADILRKDRTKVAAEFNSRRVVIANTRYMHTVARDITERRRAVEALQDSEARFRGMFEHITSGVAVYEAVDDGEDFIFLDFNPAGERIEGVRREELLGKRLTEAFPDVAHVGLLDVLRRVWRTGIPEHFAVTPHRDDRTLGWRENDVYRLRDGEVVAVYQDTTDRKQVEEALRHGAALLNAQIEASVDGILIVDEQGRKILQNQRTVDLWKIPQEIADDSDDQPQLKHIVHSVKDPERFAELVTHLYRHPEETTRDEVELVDGTVLDRYSAPVIGRDGYHYGRIWTFRDITERKKMEDDLRDSRDQLRSLTARLDDIREEERARLARELHDEVGQNLTAMRMDLAMVKAGLPAGETQLAGRLHSMIELAQNSVDRVNRMSSELRSPILDILGLQAAVEAEVAEYQERWGTEIVLTGGIGTLRALPERDLVIYRVLKEALANVRQHAEAHRVDVSLRLAGEDIVLEVLDDGIGITDERARSQDSFGLIGMRERAGRLGGTVDVERRSGGGTRVRVKVPVEPIRALSR